MKNFKMDVLELSDNGKIIKSDEKTLLSVEEIERACDWIRTKTPKKTSLHDFPNFTSTFITANKGKKVDTNGFLGGYCELSNSVYQNSQGVTIGSGVMTLGYTTSVPIYKENFSYIVAMFTAKKLIQQDWLNDKDEYLKPNENCEKFEQFMYDSIVYSIFNNSSGQSSLRQVEYKNQQWDVKNEFFWMSKDQMIELADENGYDELYNDARTSSDRYVYKLLFGEERIYDKLSPDAKLVLDKATELVKKTILERYRKANSENHLNSWDSGYAQLKVVCKEHFQEDFKEFRQLYKNLEDRMRPLVYELGFLMK
jgi:hypothetical protein